MAKQANPGAPESKVLAAEAEDILRRYPDLMAFANVMKSLIDARAATVERLDELMIPVTLITGEEKLFALPPLGRPIASDDDRLLEAFRDIMRITMAQAPDVYRLINKPIAKPDDGKQVTAA